FDQPNVPLLGQEFVSEQEIDGSMPALPARGVLGPKRLSIVDQNRLFEFQGFVTYSAVGIERVNPPTVSTTGGTEVTFAGFGFDAGLTPRLGGLPLTGFALIDSGTIRGFSPALPPGLHEAQVVNSDSSVVAALEGAVQA